jgi:hypothetical protein
MLDDAFKLIESLRAKFFKSRSETQKALGEKEKAESDCLNATLKLDQTQAKLYEAQEAMNAMSKDRRKRYLSQAFSDTSGVRARVHVDILSFPPSGFFNHARALSKPEQATN